MIFKIGDKVQIKSNRTETHGTHRELRLYLNKIYTISNVVYNMKGIYLKEHYNIIWNAERFIKYTLTIEERINEL